MRASTAAITGVWPRLQTRPHSQEIISGHKRHYQAAVWPPWQHVPWGLDMLGTESLHIRLHALKPSAFATRAVAELPACMIICRTCSRCDCRDWGAARGALNPIS
jgi:hypothetical protein